MECHYENVFKTFLSLQDTLVSCAFNNSYCPIIQLYSICFNSIVIVAKCTSTFSEIRNVNIPSGIVCLGGSVAPPANLLTQYTHLHSYAKYPSLPLAFPLRHKKPIQVYRCLNIYKCSVLHFLTDCAFPTALCQESFVRAKNWVKELQRQASPNIVIALAGNKADLANKRTLDFQVCTSTGLAPCYLETVEQGSDYFLTMGLHIF